MTEQTMNVGNHSIPNTLPNNSKTLPFNPPQSAMTFSQPKMSPNWLTWMIDEKLNGVRQEILSAAYSENCIICERALEQERGKNAALEQRNYALQQERQRNLEIIFCLRWEIQHLLYSLNEARGLILGSKTQICELPQARNSREDDSTSDSSFGCCQGEQKAPVAQKVEID